MARPLTPVTAPQAEPPRLGLLASNPPVTGQGERWTGGLTYDPEGCNDGEIFGTCDYGTPTTDIENRDFVSWYPYILSVTTQCSTFSGGAEEVQGRALRLLNQQTETLIGRELWTGDFAQTETDNPNVWLAHPDSDNLSESGPVGFVHALACLQQYLANNNGGKQGMIHATPQTITHWESFRLLRREGSKILTFQDHIVVPSPGYTGTSPDGDIGNDNVWAYATDMVRVWLTEPTTSEPLALADRSTNTYISTAQRYALAEWERCRHAGVRLAMDVCDSGGS